MGSQPIGWVHPTEGIFPSIWPYSICLASTPALQAGESSSTLDRVTNKGNGSARGGRLPCKQDIQIGSIPIFSTSTADV